MPLFNIISSYYFCSSQEINGKILDAFSIYPSTSVYSLIGCSNGSIRLVPPLDTKGIPTLVIASRRPNAYTQRFGKSGSSLLSDYKFLICSSVKLSFVGIS